MIAEEDRGALIYLHQTSKGFTAEKIGDQSFLTFHRERRLPSLPESERKIHREIGLGAQILFDLNLKRIRLSDQSPAKSGRAGRIRYRDCGAGPGEVLGPQEFPVETWLAASQAAKESGL